VQARITSSGFPQARTLLRGVAAAGRALSGPLVSLSSNKPYARYIETGTSSRARRRAGPARMFELGIAAVRPQIGPTIARAIPGGAAAVETAKRQLNDRAVAEVRARTPVVSGALRASVQPSERPR
jgi:hypothetical protein